MINKNDNKAYNLQYNWNIIIYDRPLVDVYLTIYQIL